MQILKYLSLIGGSSSNLSNGLYCRHIAACDKCSEKPHQLLWANWENRTAIFCKWWVISRAKLRLNIRLFLYPSQMIAPKHLDSPQISDHVTVIYGIRTIPSLPGGGGGGGGGNCPRIVICIYRPVYVNSLYAQFEHPLCYIDWQGSMFSI